MREEKIFLLSKNTKTKMGTTRYNKTKEICKTYGFKLISVRSFNKNDRIVSSNFDYNFIRELSNVYYFNLEIKGGN